MAFDWKQDVGVGASIDAADVNEIKDNLDSIYTDLDITRPGCASGAGWSELPVSQGDPITSAQFQELRAVTDYAHNNKCPSDNTSFNSTEYATEDSTYQSTHNAGVDGTYNAGVDSGYRSAVYSSQDTTYQSTHNAGVDGTYNAGVDSGYRSTVYSSQDTTYQSTHNAGVDGTYNAGVDSGYRSTVYTTQNATYASSDEDSYIPSYYGTVFSPHYGIIK